MINIGDFVTLYNGSKGTVIAKNKTDYTITIEYEGLKLNYHIVNVRTINGVVVYAEDLDI